MKSRKRKVKHYLTKTVVGTLYLAQTGNAYLHYNYTSLNIEVDMDEPDTCKEVKEIAERARAYCKKNSYDLVMY